MHNIGFALEIILDGPHATLWDHHAKRETLRFLRKRGNDISSQDLSHLVDAILGGPERDEYGQSLSEDEWTAYRNFQIRLRLHKLVEGGAVLPEQAQETYNRIQQAQPWQPKGNGSEEFSFFMSEARWVSEEELQDRDGIENFANMTVEAFIVWAKNQETIHQDRPWDCGGGWSGYFASNPEAAINFLRQAGEQGSWPAPTWHVVLRSHERSAKVSRKNERTIADTLVLMPTQSLTPIVLEAVRWLELVRKSLPKKLRRKLWRQMWEASQHQEQDLERTLGVETALNHSGGVLGAVLYSEIAEEIPKVGPGDNPGFPTHLRKDFYELVENESPSAKLARVQIAPMLWALYRIDPEWTERTFFKRMDMDDEDSFDPFLWEAYFWRTTLSDDLLQAFHDIYFNVLRNLDVLEDKINTRVLDNAVQAFIHMAIPPDRHISTQEAKETLLQMSPAYLADAAWALKNILQGAGNKSPKLWKETIGPWFKDAWPRRAFPREKHLSERLAWMAISSGDAFPFIIETIIDRIGPEEHVGALFHLMSTEREKDAGTGPISKYPEAALILTDKLVQGESPLGDTLSQVLKVIEENDEVLAQTDTFTNLKALAT